MWSSYAWKQDALRDHQKSQNHLKWAYTNWRFDIAVQCEKCEDIVYSPEYQAHLVKHDDGGKQGKKVTGPPKTGTVAWLKLECKNRGLKTGGKKEVLKERIRQYDEGRQPDVPIPQVPVEKRVSSIG